MYELSGQQRRAAAAFERRQRLLELPTLRLRTVASVASGTADRRPNRNGDRGERPRDLGAIPARRLPEAIRFDVKRQDRMAGRARQPHRAGLRDARRPARAVDREPAGRPAARSRRSCTSARAPPRDVDPRAVPKPKRSMIPAIHSPSKFWLVITTMPRLRK